MFKCFLFIPTVVDTKKRKVLKMEGEVTSLKRGLGRTKNRSDRMLQKMNGLDDIVIEITKKEENGFKKLRARVILSSGDVGIPSVCCGYHWLIKKLS